MEQRYHRIGACMDLHLSHRSRNHSRLLTSASRLLPAHGGSFGDPASLEHAASLNINIILLRSNCQGLIQAISTNQRSVELFGVLSDIETTIASSFDFFHAFFVYRVSNGSADLWAKNSLCNKLFVLGSGPH
ncbi:unnamed protein product [Brassica rapa]|uniref:RNase H type-1 domain-containing protein n=1 Tax=Brassica campestris TaxID=3711 RepID=A0A3P6D204_BRACM|nr:unnamed protein product [Brassica rapa]VDD16791.1 unnamed protein product [Brassica rapa]